MEEISRAVIGLLVRWATAMSALDAALLLAPVFLAVIVLTMLWER